MKRNHLLKCWITMVQQLQEQLDTFPDMPATTQNRLRLVISEYQDRIFEALEVVA